MEADEHVLEEEQQPPSWWNGKTIPDHVTYKTMIQTKAAPDVVHQYTDATYRMMIAAQMLLMGLLENGSLVDGDSEKVEAEALYKEYHLFYRSRQAQHNQLENTMSLTNQKPSSY